MALVHCVFQMLITACQVTCTLYEALILLKEQKAGQASENASPF